MYNYSNLSDADFEDLARDLLGRLLNIRFEAFGRGPDGGMDGRNSVGGSTIILQAKHYYGSTYSDLKAAMKRERKSIDALSPDRYLLATSRSLQPPNKSELSSIIGPTLKAESDIFGKVDLDHLLRTFPDIEKAHVKLWLSSVAILEKVIHAATVAYSETTKAEIEAKVRVYAQNPSLHEARDKLEEMHVVIISGPPGVGKTTLAEMLSFAYIAEDWEFVAIRDLDDGFARIDDTKRQIFLFDDFLGRVALDPQSLASKDAVLTKFLKRIAGSPNARFVLTTRAYILEGARRISEHLSRPQVDVSKYLLDVGAYTRRIKARILYNHLDATNIPLAHIQSLRDEDAFLTIVDHKNYSPRIIEAMTEVMRVKDIPPDDYPAAFLSALDNPHQIWDIAFRTHINGACQHLLYAVHFSSEYGVDLKELRTAFDSLHRNLCQTYGGEFSPKDFEECLKTLEGGFLSIRGSQVSFINPSLRDYLRDYLDNAQMLSDFAKSAKKVRWADAIWKHSNEDGLFSREERQMIVESFISVARQFTDLPVMIPDPKRANTRLFFDAHFGERVQLLLEWWDVSRNQAFADLVLPCANEAVRDMHVWRDGPSFVETIQELRESHLREFPGAENVAVALEKLLVRMVKGHLNTEDLDNIFSAINEARGVISDEVYEAAVSAVHNEIEHVDDYITWEDSESTLFEHKEVLERLGKEAGVSREDLENAIDSIDSRIDEIQERTPDIAEPPDFKPSKKRTPDTFGDDDLRVLFDTLGRN